MQACYAMGYNLAIEYLADYEKTWMLDSFRSLNCRVLQAQSRPLTEWLFLEVGLLHAHPVLCRAWAGVSIPKPQADTFRCRGVMHNGRDELSKKSNSMGWYACVHQSARIICLL